MPTIHNLIKEYADSRKEEIIKDIMPFTLKYMGNKPIQVMVMDNDYYSDSILRLTRGGVITSKYIKTGDTMEFFEIVPNGNLLGRVLSGEAEGETQSIPVSTILECFTTHNNMSDNYIIRVHPGGVETFIDEAGNRVTLIDIEKLSLFTDDLNSEKKHLFRDNST